jgi:hypothetical protein
MSSSSARGRSARRWRYRWPRATSTSPSSTPARGHIARSERSLALSHGARLILERAASGSAVLGAARATPIARIDISQAGGFGQTQLIAQEHGLPALGYVVSYRACRRRSTRRWPVRALRCGMAPP